MISRRTLVGLVLASMTAIGLSLSYPVPNAWGRPGTDSPAVTLARQHFGADAASETSHPG
jgi:hypothetical protein